MHPICPQCKQELVQTRSGFWCCPDLAHGKLYRKDRLEPRYSAAWKHWEETHQDKVAAEREQAKQRKANREQRRQKREAKKQSLAKLPLACHTQLESFYSLEGLEGLFVECHARRRGAVRALSVWHRAARSFIQATDLEIDAALQRKAEDDAIPF